MVQAPEERTAKRTAYRHKYYMEHREHWNVYQRTNREKRQEWFQEYKRNLKCSMCGKSFPDYPGIIEFHHVGEGKESRDRVVSRLITDVSRKQLLAELAKCIPVCANCHRRLHNTERQQKKRRS